MTFPGYFTPSFQGDWLEKDNPRVRHYSTRVELGWRDCSPEVVRLWRQVQTSGRIIRKLEDEIKKVSFLLGKSLVKRSRVAPSTPSSPLLKATVSDTKFVLVGEKLHSGFMPEFKWAPFHKIPNVKTFRVNTSEFDKVFDYFGIKRRIAPVMEYSLYRNQACIRYVKFTVTRLRNCQSNRLYWRMVHVILSRSVVFGLMGVSHCFERWHRELPLHLVMRWVFGSMKIAGTLSEDLAHTRIYIPKPNGKMRPLGVPSPVWRVHMCILNWFLITRFDRHIPDWQHGFRPSRGTMTAWRQVLNETIKARFIYEFDLKGFFDNVDVKRVIEWLKALALKKDPIPPHEDTTTPVFGYADGARGTSPEGSVPEERKGGLPRSRLHPAPARREAVWKQFRLSAARVMLGLWETWAGRRPAWSSDSLEQYAKDNPSFKLRKWGRLPPPKGFPQGANISPFLSICLLAEMGRPAFADIVMYADDGLIYSSKPFTEAEVIDHFDSVGIEISREKSGWVRKNYQWLKPLKFLGLEFAGPAPGGKSSSWELGILKARTRKGSELEFDKAGLVKALEVEDIYFELPESPVMRSGLAPEYVLWDPTDASWSEAFVQKSEAQARRVELENLPIGGIDPLTGKYVGGRRYLKIGRVTPDRVVLTNDIDSRFTWESLARSKIFGMITSRMYCGSWNQEVDQDFRLKWTPSSWVGKRGAVMAKLNAGVRMNFANSTSFAFHDVVAIIRRSRSNVLWKNQHKSGLISLSELNARRSTMGLPPLSALYMKRFNVGYTCPDHLLHSSWTGMYLSAAYRCASWQDRGYLNWRPGRPSIVKSTREKLSWADKAISSDSHAKFIHDHGEGGSRIQKAPWSRHR